MPTFWESMRVWIKIGLLSFGGPIGQIALMHKELVEERKWISDRRFTHALNYCMILPGPEAQQLAIYTGWLLHGKKGGLAAGFWFVLPGSLFLLGVSFIYVLYGNTPALSQVFYGLKAAVLAIVAHAAWKISKRILNQPALWLLAAAAFIAIFFFAIPFPAVILTALALGLLSSKISPAEKTETSAAETSLISDHQKIPPPLWKKFSTNLLLWTALWLAPLAACFLLLGGDHLLTQQSFFFTKAAGVTFGGAYAALPYVAQQAVEVHGWLTPAQAMDGLGLAETTPGPLLLVLQFVGFVGAWFQPGGLEPWVAALIASFLTAWATFMPGYLFIFAGAPLIEHTHEMKNLRRALSAVTAAVVGVVLNLAVWFGLHTIHPDGQWDFIPLILAAAFLFAMVRLKWGVFPIITLGATAGLILG